LGDAGGGRSIKAALEMPWAVGNGVFKGVPPQSVAALTVLVAAAAMAILMSQTEAVLAPLWLLGMAAGFTLQRSRFCFASAFRDIFLFGSSRIMRGVLMGLGVATIGFAIIMYNDVPFPAFGALPREAHILPVGMTAVTGGLLFGFGMVMSGGCVSGSLYRMAEGYVGSWVSIAGGHSGLGIPVSDLELVVDHPGFPRTQGLAAVYL